MELPTQLAEVMHNASRYFFEHGHEIPEYQRDRLVAVMGPGVSPVDFIVRVSEALYAVADELSSEGQEVAAQAANLAAMNGWHGMTERGAVL